MKSPFPGKQQLKAALFDMDGVLYNSMKNHADTWVRGFKKYGISFKPEEAYLNEGRTGKSTIEKVFRETLGREALPQEVKAIYSEKTRLMNIAPSSDPMPGIKEVLSAFRQKGIKIIVVTGSSQPCLLEKLNHDFGIPPHDVVAAKDVINGKPHPEPYLKGMKKAGSTAGQTIVIENAPLGVRAAKAAGIFTIGLNSGILNDSVLFDAGADVVFDDTLSLHRWIEKHLE